MFTSLRYESLIKEQPSGRGEERRGEKRRRGETVTSTLINKINPAIVVIMPTQTCLYYNQSVEL